MDRRRFLKSATAAGIAVGVCKPTPTPPFLNTTGINTTGDRGLPFLTGFIKGRSHSMVHVLLFQKAM